MINLKQGDIFVTKNPMWLGRAINGVQKFWAADGQSTYSHAGIISSPTGETLESLWTIKTAHINNYAGDQVLIGRVSGMDSNLYRRGMSGVLPHKGQVYPFWRLVFHLFPPAARWISTGKFPVCSELACKFLNAVGVTGIGKWQGKNPDHVADMIRKWDAFDIVYEGVWSEL